MTVTAATTREKETSGNLRYFPEIAYRDLAPHQKQFLSEEGLRLLQRIIERYEQYDGLQWRDPDSGMAWTSPQEKKRFYDMDYTPTMFVANIMAHLIDRRASWMFQRFPTLQVMPQAIDPTDKRATEGYEPSPAQQTADEVAQRRMELLQRVIKDNLLPEKLLHAGRDHHIGGNVVCKLHIDPFRGMRTIWRPRLEFWPVYDPDDIDMLIEINFLANVDGDEERVWRQRYWLEGYDEAKRAARINMASPTGPVVAVPEVRCYIHEAYYWTEKKGAHLAGTIAEELVPPTDTGLPFIPVEIFPRTKLSGETEGRSLVDDLKEIQAAYNRLLSDNQDAIRHGHFPITVISDADLPTDPKTGQAEPLPNAPNAAWTLKTSAGAAQGRQAKVETLERKFSSEEAVAAQLQRLHDTMHLIAEVPQLSPEKVTGIGQLSGFAIKLLYGALISATEESHMVWEPRLERLFGKMLYMLGLYARKLGKIYGEKTLQCVAGDANLKDLRERMEDVVDVQPIIPIPENREELIELLIKERAGMMESILGAMRRAGVENPEQKLREIIEEKEMFADLFGLEITEDPPPKNHDDDPPPGDDE